MPFPPVVTLGPSSGGLGSSTIQTTLEESSDIQSVPSVVTCPVVSVPYSVQARKHTDLTQGENVIVVPGVAIGMMVVFPTPGSSPPTLKFRMVSQGTDLWLDNHGAPFGPIFFGATVPTSFILWCSGTLHDVLVLFF